MFTPLDVLKKRELKTLPPHFHKIEMCYDKETEVREWIRNRLSGRFCIVRYPSNNKDSGKTATYVAFENMHELTYFALACTFFRGN